MRCLVVAKVAKTFGCTACRKSWRVSLRLFFLRSCKRLTSPLNLSPLAVPRVIGLVGVRREFDAARIESCSRPTRRGLLRVSDVGSGGRVDDLDALVFGITSVVNVAVDVSLDVTALC